jgi:hypothetical protein
MTIDPFKAPKAHVADVDIDRALASRPASVTLACRLLWATIALGLVSLVPGVRNGLWTAYAQTPAAIVVALGFTMLMIALEAWLIRLVSRRHGWARWALLGLLILGWVLTFSDFSVSIDQGMAAVVIDLVVGMAEMVAAGLLFLSGGRTWFQREP